MTRGWFRWLYIRSVCAHLRTCTHMLRALVPGLRTGQRRLPPCRLGLSLALELRCPPTMASFLLGRLCISIYWVYALRNGSRPRLRRRWRTDGTGPTPWMISPASPRTPTHTHLARAPTAPTPSCPPSSAFIAAGRSALLHTAPQFLPHHLVSRVRDERCAMTLVVLPACGGCTQSRVLQLV